MCLVLLHSMTRWCQWPLYMSLENLTFLSEEPASLLLHTEAIETHLQFTEVINALRLVREGKSAVALALPETYESLLQSAKTFTSRIYGCACELYNSVALYSYKTALSRHRHIVLIALSRTLQSTYTTLKPRPKYNNSTIKLSYKPVHSNTMPTPTFTSS